MQAASLEADFPAFVKAAWHVIRPGVELKWSWHYDLISVPNMRFEAIMDPREDSLLYEFVGSLQSTNGRRTEMKNRLLMLSVKMQTLLMHEEGQDLIEYALVLSLIAFAAVATMNTLALDINTAYANIGAALAANT